jgi:hypothetical protein
LQKRREEERICRREYALILVARLNLPPQVATQIVLLAVPARVFNSGQACDPINVEDILDASDVAGGRVARRRRLTEDIVAGFSTSNDNVSGSREVMPTAAPEGFRPTGERTNLIPPPVRSIMKQSIGHMSSDIGMELLPDEAAWPSRPAFLQETTVLDHRLLQMLDALPDGDVLGEIMTYTRSVGQGRLFVGGECPHAWSALWLSEDGLQQLAALGAQASPTAVTSYDLTGPEQDADLTTEDTGAAKVLKSLDAGRRPREIDPHLLPHRHRDAVQLDEGREPGQRDAPAGADPLVVQHFRYLRIDHPALGGLNVGHSLLDLGHLGILHSVQRRPPLPVVAVVPEHSPEEVLAHWDHYPRPRRQLEVEHVGAELPILPTNRCVVEHAVL